MKTHSKEFLRRRKFFMALPVLVSPFLVALFWSLGGGQGGKVQAKELDVSGLNYRVPDAQFSGKEVWDKLSLYEIAARDSIKFEEARESDPYFDLIAFKTDHDEAATDTAVDKLMSGFRHKDRLAVDPNEELVNRKIEELYREINKPESGPRPQEKEGTADPRSDSQFTSDVDRLEQLMESMQRGGEPDPEMQQIEGVLEKILDIQHPARVAEKMEEQSEAKRAGAATVDISEREEITLLQAEDVEPVNPGGGHGTDALFLPAGIGNGFFGLEDEANEGAQGNTIEAVVHDTQEVVAGATIKMRLLRDVHVNGRVVPRDQLIYGICAINGERLTVDINSIRVGNSIQPVALVVYDLDGLEGIFIPGAITRDAAKQASDNTLQNVQLMTMNPSVGAQAAAAGVEAAKGLFSKKSKLVKVVVKAGYQLLLKDGSLRAQNI